MHADEAHGLRVQLATALRERDEARALAEKESRDADEWAAAAKKLGEEFVAVGRRADKAESERDALRGENGRLRDVLKALLAFPGSNATDHEQCDEGCPYKRARDALAAPADGEDGKR